MSSFSYQFTTPKPQSEKYSMENTFKNLDVENSGKIKKSTLMSAVIYTGDQYNKNVIKNQLQKCDQLITYQRFKEIFQLAQKQEYDNSAQWIFKLYDRDNKGYIDRNDLIKASQITGVPLSQQQITQMLCNNKIYEQNLNKFSQSQSQIQSQYKGSSQQSKCRQFNSSEFFEKGVSFQQFSQIMGRRML